MTTRVLVTTSVASFFGLQPATIRSWHHRGLLDPVACDVATRGNLYDLVDITRVEALTRPERVRRDKPAERVQRSSLDSCAHPP